MSVIANKKTACRESHKVNDILKVGIILFILAKIQGQQVVGRTYGDSIAFIESHSFVGYQIFLGRFSPCTLFKSKDDAVLRKAGSSRIYTVFA